jgi:uncharacterized lipoprotein
MKRRFALTGALLALLALTGCHPIRAMRNIGGSCHDPKPYMKAGSVATLKIPSGLDAPDTTNALHIPPLNEPAPPPRQGKDPCLEEPPPFVIPKRAPPQA